MQELAGLKVLLLIFKTVLVLVQMHIINRLIIFFNQLNILIQK